MTWLRSRRFYAGMAIGIVPLLLLAATQGEGPRDDARRDGHPVVVRTYAGCCPDSTDAARTKALLESLPEDVVLVETFAGCCCGDSTRVYGPTSSRDVVVPPYPITGTGPGGRPQGTTPAAPPTLETPSADIPALAVAPPIEGGAPGGFAPVGVTVPPQPVEAGFPGWLGFLVAPVALLVGEFDKDFPEGVVCGDDSGLPTGPNRPRC